MKAIILSGGKGSRLGDITNTIPKTMIKIDGKPILEHNIELCKKYNITDIYINLHHLPDIITKYFGDGSKFGVNITYSYERVLLGTSGAVKNITDKYNFRDNFYVIYGDNYSDYNLDLLKNNDSIITIAFHYREDISNSGVAVFDGNKILEFIEKPKNTKIYEKWVNAGIYYLNPDILKHIPPKNSDFAKDIFPKLLKENITIYSVKQNTSVKAFDTPEMFLKNRT